MLKRSSHPLFKIIHLIIWVVIGVNSSLYSTPGPSQDDPALSLLQDRKLILSTPLSTSLSSPSFESREFKKTLDYQINGIRVDRSTWPQKHGKAISTMGQFILGDQSYPNNVAVANVSYHLKDGLTQNHDIPMFFLSGFQKKPSLKAFKKALKEKLDASYHDYNPVYLASTIDTLQTFNAELQKLFHLSTQPRCLEREDEVRRYTTQFPFPLYYAHSEQAVYFYLLKKQDVWDDLFSSYDKKTPLLYVTLNILTYYDPCIRCGDTGYTFSETLETNGLKNMLLDFFKDVLKVKAESHLLEDTRLFVQVCGIKEYKEQTVPTVPLREGRKSRTSYGGPVLPDKMIPKVCCAAVEDLETEDED